MSEGKISVYNLAELFADHTELKNTSDDAIPNYLNSLRFTQSHRLTDVRLALGYGALAVAAACFVWDWKLGFDNTKFYSAFAVIVYMALNVALTLWSRNVEGSTVYVGTSPSGETVSIATSVEKYTPVYNVDVTVTDKKSSRTINVAHPFADWFDSAGQFVAAPFQSMLASAVPAIGKADPKRVAGTPANSSASATTPGPAYSAAMLDVLAAAAAADAGISGESDTGAATTTGASRKKGGKRRKA